MTTVETVGIDPLRKQAKVTVQVLILSADPYEGMGEFVLRDLSGDIIIFALEE